MFRKHQTILKYTRASFAVEILGAALIMVLVCLTVTMYPAAGDTVPRHFNAMGIIDEWGGKSAILLTPLFAGYFYLILTGAGILARRVPGSDREGSAFPAVLMMILCGKAVYLVYAIIKTWGVMTAQNLPAGAFLIMPIGIGLTLVFGIHNIIKMKTEMRASRIIEITCN